MPAITLTTVSPFEQVLFRKNLEPFIGEIVIPFFQRYDFLHANSSGNVRKNSRFFANIPLLTRVPNKYEKGAWGGG
jgi:hypothetical protein